MKILSFLILIFGINGCFSFRESEIYFAVQDPPPAKEKKNFQVWIKIVNSPEFKHNIPKDNVNAIITYSLYKFIRELNQFEKVNILYSSEIKLPENAILLDFQFSKMEEKDKFHSMYFPFGIIGLVLGRKVIDINAGFLFYTGLGGPDTVHKINYSGNLIAYNAIKEEKVRTPLLLETEFNSNMLYYDKATETNIKRKEMLSIALENILKGWEKK